MIISIYVDEVCNLELKMNLRLKARFRFRFDRESKGNDTNRVEENFREKVGPENYGARRVSRHAIDRPSRVGSVVTVGHHLVCPIFRSTRVRDRPQRRRRIRDNGRGGNNGQVSAREDRPCRIGEITPPARFVAVVGTSEITLTRELDKARSFVHDKTRSPWNRRDRWWFLNGADCHVHWSPGMYARGPR